MDSFNSWWSTIETEYTSVVDEDVARAPYAVVVWLLLHGICQGVDYARGGLTPTDRAGQYLSRGARSQEVCARL